MDKGEDGSLLRIRLLVLVGLCLQTTGFALLTRYSRTVLHEEYSSIEVVVLAEVVKMLVSGFIAVKDKVESDVPGQGVSKLLWLILHAKKIIVLVVMYSMANLLSYYALARIDVSIYTVMTQLKSLTTAGMAVLILGRNISLAKWRALLLMVLGCILVASPTYNIPNSDFCGVDGIKSAEAGSQLDGGEQNQDLVDSGTTSNDNIGQALLGVGAVLIMVILSGFSAVYFESMLKGTGEKVTIWERNFQLAFYSVLLVALLRVYQYLASGWQPTDNSEVIDGAENSSSSEATFFKGWSIITVIIALSMASNGLLVAATLKYADAVLKTLATAGSIVLSSLFGALLLGDLLDIFIATGCTCTILAIVNYTFE